MQLMAKLIADWDIDAQLLTIAGHQSVKRLPRHSYLRSQILGRQLSNVQSKSPLQQGYVVDDNGTPIKVFTNGKKYLPQTYVSASFLLALTDAEQIVALPKGLRSYTSLFPTTLTDQIPRDIDRYNSETLFLAKPSIAFVANYSHPALLNALQEQGVQLFTLTKLNSIPEIGEAIIRTGQAIEKPLQAELLALFIESAIQSIDNRLLAMSHALIDNTIPKTLFMNYHSQFTTPTSKSLNGQLIERLGIAQNLKETDNEWVVPVDQEHIININPECLIIATPNRKSVEKHLYSNEAFAKVAAIKNRRIYFVDETIQQFPSQYIVLAYYDLFHALAQASML
jgi:iron complex transport system substrate-binding protein